MLSPPPPHRGGSGGGGGGCSGGGRGARAAGGRGEPGLVRPPRTAARHPAIGAGGRTAARRLGVRMMKLSKPPASPPRRTAAAGADTCARAAEAARDGGGGGRGVGIRSQRQEGMQACGSGRGQGGGEGGLDAPSQPLGRDWVPRRSSGRIRRGLLDGAFYGDAPFLNNIRKAHLPCMQDLQQIGAPVPLPIAPVEMLVKGDTLPEVIGLLPAILYTRPRAAGHKIVQ